MHLSRFSASVIIFNALAPYRKVLVGCLCPIIIALVLARLQNVTIKIGEVTCGDDDYFNNLTLQVWDKDIWNDDLLGEMFFNVSSSPQNISIYATENELFTMSPYLIFLHYCNGPCVRSRMSIASEYVGGTYVNPRVDLNSTFDETKPC